MKQVLFDRIITIIDRNIGIELEITEGFLFDTTIAARMSNGKSIFVNLFDIEQKKVQLIYEGGEIEIYCDNNWTVYEFEKKLRETYSFVEC